MNTCKTCKWWDMLDNDPREHLQRSCQNAKLDYINNDADGASPVDAEGYSAFIQTGPDFGCVHHELK